MIKSEICEMLGIQYPVFQGGMAWVADGHLAAAVSQGGGLGIIGAGNAPASYVREQIRIVRSLTDKPFGVNIMLLSPFADEVAQVVAEEKVAVELATAAALDAAGIHADMTAGFSLGELAALSYAHIVDISTSFQLVCRRAS